MKRLMESKTSEADKKTVKGEKQEKEEKQEKQEKQEKEVKKEMSQTPITKHFETLESKAGTECLIMNGNVNYII